MMIPHNHDRLSFTSFAHDQEHIISNPNPNSQPASTSTSKRKRNLPGNPDPDAEVLALSPKSLMATNRFFCEICHKGFQREQNLQLHKRGHNLPWKLKQKTNKDVKKKVYICPEKSCVHHDPTRALGDLTGIKKHFSRKHGEKKWKCDNCSKKYAVVSDWKAHSKICGSREYRCDCGTLFSRKDSFITHRAFCDALAHETTKFVSSVSSPSAANSTISTLAATNNPILIQSQLDHSHTRTACPNVNRNQTTLLGYNFGNTDQIPPQTNAFALTSSQPPRGTSDSFHNLWRLQGDGLHHWLLNEYMNNSKNVLHKGISKNQENEIKIENIYNGSNATGPNISSMFLKNQKGNLASLSATTLLQKAAQLGSSSSSNASPLFGLMTSRIFNNSMPNSNCLTKPKSKEDDFTRDFLGVGSRDDKQRVHHYCFSSSVPSTVNHDNLKLAATSTVGGEPTAYMASDSEDTRFC